MAVLHYAADFETTTDPEDCRVWAWGAQNIDGGPFEYGVDIEGFFEWCAKRSAIVWFHNLAFDGAFIIDRLLRLGFKHTPRENGAKPYSFHTVISSSGQFYSITVHWESQRRSEFRDSLKKLPMTVSKIADSFNLPMKKLEIDYHENRPIGHELTSQEVDYLRNDVQIVAEAIRIQIGEGMTRLTVGADSLAEYKELSGGKKMFERLFPIL